MITYDSWRLTIKVPDVQRGYWPVATSIRSFYALCIIWQTSSCGIYFLRLEFVFPQIRSQRPALTHIRRAVLTRRVICADPKLNGLGAHLLSIAPLPTPHTNEWSYRFIDPDRMNGLVDRLVPQITHGLELWPLEWLELDCNATQTIRPQEHTQNGDDIFSHCADPKKGLICLISTTRQRIYNDNMLYTQLVI